MQLNPSQTILIVEDSDDDFFATERAFKKSGLRNPIKRCVTGDQALDYLYHRGEFAALDTVRSPGIILLDLNLPGTDGREVLHVLKSDPTRRKIPASGSIGLKSRCFPRKIRWNESRKQPRNR